jgi:hypothetical protein
MKTQTMPFNNQTNYRLPPVIVKQDEPGKRQGEKLNFNLASQSNRSFYTLPQSASSVDSESQAIDDLTTQLSQTFLNTNRSTEAHQLATVAGTERKDAIDQVITSVLTQDLRAAGSGKLLPDHPCFDHVRQYARKWHISDEAVNSNIKLACGYLKFPVIMLLNPAPKHESLPFDTMVARCRTLRWIEDVLLGVGLSLADVIILDICPLLSNDRIKQLEKEGLGRKQQALSEAYDVTQKLLGMIQPSIVISCQCSTSFSNWVPGGHVIARELCSSMKSARAREVKAVSVGEHKINVVQAYHPSSFLNHNRRGHHDFGGQFLKALFQRLYNPCSNWKNQHIMALIVSANNSLVASTNTSPPRREETDRTWNTRAERWVRVTISFDLVLIILQEIREGYLGASYRQLRNYESR